MGASFLLETQDISSSLFFWRIEKPHLGVHQHGGNTSVTKPNGPKLAFLLTPCTASYEHEFFLGVEIFLKYTPEQTISP